MSNLGGMFRRSASPAIPHRKLRVSLGDWTPYREIGVAMPLSQYVFQGISIHRFYTLFLAHQAEGPIAAKELCKELGITFVRVSWGYCAIPKGPSRTRNTTESEFRYGTLRRGLRNACFFLGKRAGKRY